MSQILKGQRALVTGASTGIGKAVATALAEAGANVLINYVVGKEVAEQVASEIAAATGSTVLAHQADVSQEAQVIDMFARMKNELGGIDILVNNAGLQRDAAFHDLTLAQWNTVIGVNLTGQFLCAREAIRHFRAQGMLPHSKALGKIVCISSVHEVIPWAGHVNYAASKGGVMMMMKSIAQEYAASRIRVNSICPGAIRTPINREAWETPEAYDSLMKLVPYKRIGEPEDIGKAAVWLSSDESDYVTGTSMFVDGGMLLYPGFESGG